MYTFLLLVQTSIPHVWPFRFHHLTNFHYPITKSSYTTLLHPLHLIRSLQSDPWPHTPLSCHSLYNMFHLFSHIHYWGLFPHHHLSLHSYPYCPDHSTHIRSLSGFWWHFHLHSHYTQHCLFQHLYHQIPASRTYLPPLLIWHRSYNIRQHQCLHLLS